jgi:hypothetical protein
MNRCTWGHDYHDNDYIEYDCDANEPDDYSHSGNDEQDSLDERLSHNSDNKNGLSENCGRNIDNDQDVIDDIIKILDLLNGDDASKALLQLPDGLYREVSDRRTQQWLTQQDHDDDDTITRYLHKARENIACGLSKLRNAINDKQGENEVDNMLHNSTDGNGNNRIDGQCYEDDSNDEVRVLESLVPQDHESESNDDLPPLYYPDLGKIVAFVPEWRNSLHMKSDSAARYEEQLINCRLRSKIHDLLASCHNNKKFVRRVVRCELHNALTYGTQRVHRNHDECMQSTLSDHGIDTAVAVRNSNAISIPACSHQHHGAGDHCSVAGQKLEQTQIQLIELVRETLALTHCMQRKHAIASLPGDIRKIIEADVDLSDTLR